MNSITRNYSAPVRERGSVSASDRAKGVRNWIEQAHTRRPRQEFWQWLHAQVRHDRANGN